MDSDTPLWDFDSELADVRLLHLADSALPIGALAHSFGLESLVARGLIGTGDLPEFLRGFLEEAGVAEAVFCREAFRLAEGGQEDFCAGRWVELNDRLSALKPARESRMGSASLGKNFLMVVAALEDFAIVREALRASKEARSLVHHCSAFGLASGALKFEEVRALVSYLHQCVGSLVSACQRLLPLGQNAATRILWDLKPAVIETAKRSLACSVDDASCFMPLLDWGAMEHPALATRLFIS